MCIDPDWMPLEKIENGRHIGMTAEYITILANTIGVPIVMVPTRDWTESMAFAKARKCDIFSLAMPTPERRTYMNFTRPYLSIPLVMAAKTETPFIDSIAAITDKKIGIVKGYAFNEILRQRFPNMQIVDVASISAGLKQVVENELFGFIGTLATVGYTIQKDFVGALKVTGKFDERWELGIAARNDEPLLVNIFDKAITAIDSTTHQKILNNWIAVRYDRKPDYGLLIQILLLVFTGIAILLYRNHALGKYNKKLERQNLEITRQAEKLKDNLKIFEAKKGLAACDKDYEYQDRQWNYPIIWAPLQYICYEGMKKYGYYKEARKINKDFVKLVYQNWKKTGKIWEKYNGHNGSSEKVPFDRYSSQSGFGWTNAVAEVFIKESYNF